MKIQKSTKRFERWLARHTSLVQSDLRLKHKRMAESPFMFLRATFYRWVQLWPDLCPKLAKAPGVLAVGDLHIENFGTWRDSEGRLIWGVNDFDEAYEMSYTNDLVRLATSAILAADDKRLSIEPKAACDAILKGYCKALKSGGHPFVLGEHNKWLRDIAESELRDPVHFWEKMDALESVTDKVPVSAIEALEHLLPERGLPYKLVRRVAGLGSLGHQRIVAIAEWHGGRIAREAKALVPSSCYWAAAGDGSPEIAYSAIMTRAVRCPDPFVRLRGHWIVRRLSPHNSRIEIESLPAKRDDLKLLESMGWETANIHMGTPNSARKILRDLQRRQSAWLHESAASMRDAIASDWHDWKKMTA
ncbi:MAG TPA: DUF2252 family protein [Terriglobales bacterium]|nr:DUF2252 family protein [Terriglobales bacterium]